MQLLFSFFCRDLDKQLAFYESLLSLPETKSSRTPIYCSIKTDSFELGFHSERAYSLLDLESRIPDGDQACPIRGYPTFLLPNVASLDEAVAKVISLGGRIIKMPYATYYGHWQTVLADVEDNVIRLTVESLPTGVMAPALAL